MKNCHFLRTKQEKKYIKRRSIEFLFYKCRGFLYETGSSKEVVKLLMHCLSMLKK